MKNQPFLNSNNDYIELDDIIQKKILIMKPNEI